LAAGRRTFRPSVYGKVATATYIITTAAVLLFNYLGRTSWMIDVGVWACFVITLVSGFHYGLSVRRVLNEPPASS
jgi:phosphatidylglycerophosphate synthase